MGKDKIEKTIDSTYKKYKRRMKRICLCGVFWTFFAVLCIVVGITMLVYFSKYWGDQDNWRRGLAYFGVALLILFVISLAIGVVLFVILRKIYEHMAGTGSSGGESGGFKKMFRPPNYAMGEAPYPQQPPELPQRTVEPAGPDGSPSRQPLQPGPQQPSAPPSSNLADVNIEVSDHHKF